MDYGISFLRFTNEEVLRNLPGVLMKISAWIDGFYKGKE